MFKKILVPLDGAVLSEQALGVAGAIARASDAALDLILVHQPVPFPVLQGERRNAAQWEAEDKYLEAIVDELSTSPGVQATHTVVGGNPADAIRSRAIDVGADLIVMTSHGRTGINRAWLGSVTDDVVRSASIPVLVLRAADSHVPRGTRLFNRIVVPLDGSRLSADILDSATDLARCAWARLFLLRVVPPVPLITAEAPITWAAYPSLVRDEKATQQLVAKAEQELDAVAQTLASQGVRDVEAHVIVSDTVAEAIIDFAREQDGDLIAMATHGRGATRLLLGSIADKVLRAAGLPLLLRRPEKKPAELDDLDAGEVEQQLPAVAGMRGSP